MVDSHCHLADDAFAGDLDAVIARARQAGLVGALCVVEASAPEEAARAEAVVRRWNHVRTTAGVHPHRAAAFAADPQGAVALVRARLQADGAVRAVGEIGLDYHYDLAPREVQREVFAAQVAFARDAGLPVVVHTREADDDTVEILERVGAGALAGVFHCFSGDSALARRAVALGFYVSFSGILTFPKAQAVRDAAAAVPVDRLLVETDCPYLAPVPWRGRRNEPAWVGHVCTALAAVHGASTETMAGATTANYGRLFNP